MKSSIVSKGLSVIGNTSKNKLSKHGFKIIDVRTTPKIGRNALCLCGSGLKNKKCCNKKY